MIHDSPRVEIYLFQLCYNLDGVAQLAYDYSLFSEFKVSKLRYHIKATRDLSSSWAVGIRPAQRIGTPPVIIKIKKKECYGDLIEALLLLHDGR